MAPRCRSSSPAAASIRCGRARLRRRSLADLSAVHDQGVIHRDLKPENVFLLDPSGQDGNKDFVKIVDFGIAKQADEHAPVRPESSANGIFFTSSGADLRLSPNTLPGTLLGTPGYMSPEQARGGAVDFRVDQYSLGCILFEMLSGTLPFDDETIGGLLRKHLDEPPPSVRQRFPQLPVSPALDSLVLRLLAKRPAARFGTMREVAEALEREIDLLLVERGERSTPSKSTWGRVSRSLLGSDTREGVGRRVPLWAMLVPLTAMLLGLIVWLASPLAQSDGKTDSGRTGGRRAGRAARAGGRRPARWTARRPAGATCRRGARSLADSRPGAAAAARSPAGRSQPGGRSRGGRRARSAWPA